MIYEVTVLPRAKAQLLSAALWWSEHRNPEQALRWLDGFELAIASLAVNPQSHALILEHFDQEFTQEYRQLNYGLGKRLTHRAVFEIRDAAVYVHAVRHLAQDSLAPEDFR